MGGRVIGLNYHCSVTVTHSNQHSTTASKWCGLYPLALSIQGRELTALNGGVLPGLGYENGVRLHIVHNISELSTLTRDTVRDRKISSNDVFVVANMVAPVELLVGQAL